MKFQIELDSNNPERLATELLKIVGKPFLEEMMIRLCAELYPLPSDPVERHKEKMRRFILSYGGTLAEYAERLNKMKQN